MAITGGCHCGNIWFEGKGALGAVHVCHCDDCARWSGGPSISVDFADGIEINGKVAWYQSSERGERGFCPKCGSALFYRLQDKSYINVAVGQLDNRAAIETIDSHIFIDRKPGFYDFSDTAPRLTGAEFIAQIEGEKTEEDAA